jgi:hypothetical protein
MVWMGFMLILVLNRTSWSILFRVNGDDPYYPFLNWTTMTMAGSYLLGRRRNFHFDSVALVSSIQPPLVVRGTLPTSSDEGYVVTVNHYWRPGFTAMWIGMTISATIPQPIHWAMTSAWIYPDLLRSITITPLSRWFLRKIANSYGFTLMPPMSPHVQDMQGRIGAVRSLLRYVQSTTQPIIAIAPEGINTESGCLTTPPNGIGRLLFLFLERGLRLLPCGLYEENGHLYLHFGEPLKPSIKGLQRQDREGALVSLTMRAIAACLPERLRGPYA